MRTRADFEQLAKGVISCICDEAYTSRSMSAPDCAFCNYEEDITDLMVTAYNMALKDASEAANLTLDPGQVVVDREAILKLEIK